MTQPINRCANPKCNIRISREEVLCRSCAEDKSLREKHGVKSKVPDGHLKLIKSWLKSVSPRGLFK